MIKILPVLQFFLGTSNINYLFYKYKLPFAFVQIKNIKRRQNYHPEAVTKFTYRGQFIKVPNYHI